MVAALVSTVPNYSLTYLSITPPHLIYVLDEVQK